MHDDASRAPARPGGLADVERRALDRLTRTAGAACGAPVAVVSLVDGGTQHLLSQLQDGAPWPERVPVARDLCGRVVSTGGALAVPDVAAAEGLLEPGRLAELGVGAYLGVPLVDEADQVLGALCVIDRSPRDWSEAQVRALHDVAASAASEVSLRRALAAASSSRATTSTVLTAAMDAIVVMDGAGVVVEWNPAAERTFGWTRAEALGRALSGLIVPPEHRDAHDAGVRRHVAAPAPHRFGRRLELEAVRRDGSRFPVELTMTRADVEGSPRVTGYLRDISERRALEARLQHLAYHDPLTGLLNRAGLERRLDEVLAEAAATGQRVALLYLDVDDFKDVNDALGHGVGDDLLRHVADVLRATCPEGSLLGRHGGDEFMVVLHGPGVDRLAAVRAAEALRNGLGAAVTVAGPGVAQDGVGASIGVSLHPDDAHDGVELLAHADAAMYRAKRDGRRLAAVYDVRSDDASRRLSLLARLRRAIAREELGLHFQPLLDLGTGVPESAECLARWEDRVHGRVAPDVFVELAESGGLVVALGELVVHRAAAQLAAWDAAGVRVPALAVNISARHLRNGALLDTIDSALAAHGLEHRRLVVELTESAVMEDADRTMPVLRALRERGVSVSVDDFGTGYSSLARLLHLPVDVIKLDRTFIAPLPDPRALALVEAVQRLGQGLGLSTVAEGVETAAQLRQLQQIGYRYGQGYHIARPMPADQFELWLAGRTGTRPLTAATA